MINNNRITYNDIKEVAKNNNGFMKFFYFKGKTKLDSGNEATKLII